MSAHDGAWNGGGPGAGARREGARRRVRREARVRESHPRSGGIRLALRETPAHELAWTRGAEGEERVAEILAKRLEGRAVVLHDRRVPRSRANIDHIAVAASGVWVVDTKAHTGKVHVSRPLFGEPRITIAGRGQRKLIDRLAREVERVRPVVEQVSVEVPVHGALCFVNADLPLFRKLELDGFALLYPRALAKRIGAAGPVPPARVAELAVELSRFFPCA